MIHNNRQNFDKVELTIERIEHLFETLVPKNDVSLNELETLKEDLTASKKSLAEIKHFLEMRGGLEES